MTIAAYASAAIVTIALGAPTSVQAVPDPGNCDRTGDAQITTVDALVALHEAVFLCKIDHACDSNGDFEMTAGDALVLLRAAVGLPADLQCSCIYFEECFEDSDCLESFSSGFFCAGYLCVQCEDHHDCDSGEACDPCTRECVAVPAPNALVTD